MAGICGIFRFDRSPVEESRLAAMATAAQYRGGDGIGYWINGNAGLAHLAFLTTPESRLEHQPATYLDGRYVLAADARIDNRDELLPKLFPERVHADFRTIPDTDIIFRAWMKWRQDSPKALIGDFAFVLWDSKEQKLFAARDTMGMRQLFYYTSRDTLYVATTISSLLAAVDRQPELNIPWIRDFICHRRQRWLTETVYAGIHRLPPTYFLTAARDELETTNYHVFGTQPPDCTDDEEWICEFRSLFDEVLKTQLRSTTPVGVQLSGGLDSSAIACAAHRLVRVHDLPPIKLISVHYDQTTGADEREFFDLVANACPDREQVILNGDGFWGFKDFDLSSGFPLDEPDLYILRAHTMALYRAVAASGCRVGLSGDMSNFVLGDAVYATPRALRAYSVLKALVELKHFRKHTGKSLSGLAVRACAPEFMLRFIRRIRNEAKPVPPWLNPSPEDPCPSNPAIAKEIKFNPDMSIVGRAALQHALSPYNVTRMGHLDMVAAFSGMELRIPYIDRRILEFAFRLPAHLACAGALNRVILRRSMEGLVPEAVRSRMSRSGVTHLSSRGFREEQAVVDHLLSSPILEEMGLIDAAVLRRWIERYRAGEGEAYIKLADTRLTLCLENWLRTLPAVN